MQPSPKQVVGLILMAAFGPLILMLAGGDARWTMGWVFAAFSFTYALSSRLLIFSRNPELFAERSEAMKKGNIEGWDKKLMPWIAVILPMALILVAGLDHRFGWTSPFPLGVQLAAYIPMVFGAAFAQWAVMENAYFSAVVRIQTDRGQTVVSTGPYRIIRHPGYAGAMLFNLSLPFALGSFWACVPLVLLLVLTVVRTALEDRTLVLKLLGYREYAERTRRRLVPLVW